MPSGILLLDKPQGLTSNGVLQRVRKAFRASSAGHVGTLDPMATGMLPICLDEATKVIADIEAGAKAYEFTLQLGTRTDTGDADGQSVETRPVPMLEPASLEGVLGRFRGPQQQIPPMYSALKREGRPLYELARQGLEVERAPRAINILSLALLSAAPEQLQLRCECSKGTYIRVLGEDLAKALGTVGHLTRLRRIWVEPFQDLPLQTLEAVLAAAGDPRVLLPPDAALRSLPLLGLTEPQTAAIRQGQVISHEDAAPLSGRRVRLYGPSARFLGLAEVTGEGRVQPRRLLRPDLT